MRQLPRRGNGRTCPAPEAAEQAPNLSGFPRDQNLARVEDRRIGATDDADQKRKDELLGRLASEEVERKEREDDGQRSVDRPYDRLREAVIDDLFEAGRRLAGKVFTNPVE